MRFGGQRSRQGDPLPLAAGKAAGAALEQCFETEEPGEVPDAALTLGGRCAAKAQPELDVPTHRPAGEKGVVLGHITDAATRGLEAVHGSPAEPDLAPGEAAQACDALDKERLTASRPPEQDEVLPRPDLKIHLLEAEVADGVGEAAKLDQLTAPFARRRGG